MSRQKALDLAVIAFVRGFKEQNGGLNKTRPVDGSQIYFDGTVNLFQLLDKAIKIHNAADALETPQRLRTS